MNKIMVSMLVNLGDVVMMTAVLDLIRQNYPQAQVAVLVRPESECIVKGNPLVDVPIVYSYQSGSIFKGLKKSVELIKSFDPDIYISLDRRSRSAFAALFAGVKKRLAPDVIFIHSQPSFWIKLLFNQNVTMTADDFRNNGFVEIFQLPLRKGLGLTGQGRIVLPPVEQAESTWANQFLASAKSEGRPVIGLCVKTWAHFKTWPQEAYAILIKRLVNELNAFIFITGVASDRVYVEELIAKLPQSQMAMNLAGQISLPEARALIVQADAFITPDNGIAHIAANSGQKQLVCILQEASSFPLAESMPQARFFNFARLTDNNHDALSTQADQIFTHIAQAILPG